MKNKKKQCFIICILFSIVIVGVASAIMKVNIKYKNPKQIYIEKGKPYAMDEKFMLTVQSTSFLEPKEMLEKYKEVLDLSGQYESKGIEVKVTIKNITNQEQQVELYKLYLESNTHYCNGMALEMFLCNGNDEVAYALKPGEETQIILPYELSQVQFSKTEWANIEDTKFYLVNERYPNKLYWCIR